MKNSGISLKETIFNKLSDYGHKVGELSVKARQRVFGFKLRSTIHADRLILPVKLLHDHRLLQRWRAHRQSGGERSSVAQHALDKIRQHVQR